MKHAPQYSDLNNNFRPSKFSAGGFLGDDARTVEEIISADEYILNKSGIPAEIIADSLSEIYDRAVNSQGQSIVIRPGIFAAYYESRGSIPCPFRGHGAFEKGEVVLSDKNSGKEIIITRLAIHLIKEHKFFQGTGSRFRIDPSTAVEMLGLR